MYEFRIPPGLYTVTFNDNKYPACVVGTKRVFELLHDDCGGGEEGVRRVMKGVSGGTTISSPRM